MSVSQALSLWPTLMATGLRLGSPAPTQNGVLGDASWLGQFMSGARSQNLKVDFIAVHYYSTDQDVAGFRNWLGALYDQYNKPIWVTEWCLADWSNPGRFSAAEQASFAQAGTAMMDSLPFVERQAWFAAYNGGDGWDLNSGVFDASGNLTSVGLAFRDLNTSVPGPTTSQSSAIGPDTIAVNASASLAGGVGAYFTLIVDGITIGSATVDSTSTQAYSFNTALVGGGSAAHDIQVKFENDAVINGQDRNLYLQSISVNGQTTAATSGAEIYHATGSASTGFGPGDVTSSGNMYWQGAAEFSLPAAAHSSIGTGGTTTAVGETALEPAILRIIGNKDGGITLLGRSAAGSTVMISDTSLGLRKTLGSVTAGSDGAFSLTTHDKVETAAVNIYSATARNAAGQSSGSVGLFQLSSASSDSLSGTAGQGDVFATFLRTGNDVISGFETTRAVGAGHDVVNLSGTGYGSYSQVAPNISGTSSALIQLDATRSVTLLGLAASSLQASDFRFS